MEDVVELKYFFSDFMRFTRAELNKDDRFKLQIVRILELVALLLPFLSNILSSNFNILTRYSPLIFILLSFLLKMPSSSKICLNMLIFFFLSVSFGQKFLPKNPIDIFIWSLFAAAIANSFKQSKIGLTIVVFAHLASAPVLVLDWNRWWQVWPNPANVALGLTNFSFLVYFEVFAR